ncbi:MAG TPA: hypothetical protein VFB20_10730 [Burkholderiales bacterium]|nr:hypothetical protein [Burkholderiales bacterium]
MPDWRVTITHPDATFAVDCPETTALSALAHAEHQFSLRMDKNLNTITRISIERVVPPEEIEGVPA